MLPNAMLYTAAAAAAARVSVRFQYLLMYHNILWHYTLLFLYPLCCELLMWELEGVDEEKRKKQLTHLNSCENVQVHIVPEFWRSNNKIMKKKNQECTTTSSKMYIQEYW